MSYKSYRTLIIAALITCTSATIWYLFILYKKKDIIKVGILHSLTGHMAISEKPVIDATIMAIDELNKSGGLLGRQIVPIIVDGKSDWPTFALEAEKLITQEKVATIFGCWTSASRKMVKPVVEKYNNLLFYPLQYEGLEESPNIVYTGSTANQQIIPGVTWCLQHLGKKLFLVGTDYIFQRAANEIIKDLIAAREGSIVGEEYIPLDSTDISHIIEKIVETQPNVIINTLNGDANIAFFKALRAQNISSEKIPIMSFSISECELQYMNIEDMIGNYTTWSYFQSVDRHTNAVFVKNFKKQFGPDRVTNAPMEAAYCAVYIWSKAVIRAKTTDTDTVRSQLCEESLSAPEGIIYLDKDTQHSWKMVRIGKILSTKQFGIVWDSVDTVSPMPYPTLRTKEEWNALLNYWYTQWGNKWSK